MAEQLVWMISSTPLIVILVFEPRPSPSPASMVKPFSCADVSTVTPDTRSTPV